jgi:transcriptional regulator with XRE-family HTH domain
MEKFRIKQLLRERHMTFQQLAEQLGVHRVSLSSSLTGNPTLSRLENISEKLGVEVPDLFVKSGRESVGGYLEYEGEITKVNSIMDVEAFLDKIKPKTDENSNITS